MECSGRVMVPKIILPRNPRYDEEHENAPGATEIPRHVLTFSRHIHLHRLETGNGIHIHITPLCIVILCSYRVDFWRPGYTKKEPC